MDLSRAKVMATISWMLIAFWLTFWRVKEWDQLLIQIIFWESQRFSRKVPRKASPESFSVWQCYCSFFSSKKGNSVRVSIGIIRHPHNSPDLVFSFFILVILKKKSLKGTNFSSDNDAKKNHWLNPPNLQFSTDKVVHTIA